MAIVTINVPAEATQVLDDYAKQLGFAGAREMTVDWLKRQYVVAKKRASEQQAKDLTAREPAPPAIT